VGDRPVADVFPVVVGAQSIRLVPAAGPLITPQPVLCLLNRRHERAIRQVCKRMSAIETVDILEENQMLAVSAVKGFHIGPKFTLDCKVRSQGGACARKSRA
jgi:hypothetical protein